MKILGSYIIIALSLFSCNTENKLKEYYFPVESMDIPVIYEYVSVNRDSFAPEKWKMQRIKNDKGLYLKTEIYIGNELKHEVLDKIVSNGVLTKEYKLYDYINQKQYSSEANITSKSSFGFDMIEKEDVVVFSMDWLEPTNDSIKNYIVKNSRYYGESTYDFNGNEVPIIIIKTKNLVENEQEGMQSFEFNSIQYYAKGIGLVYFKKEITENFVIESRLNKILR